VVRLERRRQVGQRLPLGSKGEADPQFPGLVLGRVPRIVECRHELGIGGLQPVSQPCAERREADLAASPLEQLPASPAFKRGDDAGDPRLSKVEPFGCPAEVQLLGEG
jgi:hypothetical protein